LAFEDLGFIFTSDEYRDWIFREVELRLEKLGQDRTPAARASVISSSNQLMPYMKPVAPVSRILVEAIVIEAWDW